MSLMSLANSPLHFVQSAVSAICLKTLSKIKEGSLSLVYKGQKYHFGEEKSKLSAAIEVINPQFWTRLVMFSALGLAEAFMYQDIIVDDLYNLLLILAKNRDNMSDGQQLLPFGLNFLINNLFTSRISNSIMNALGNISAHYDLGNDMFQAFLDETMTYSCPIWASEDEPLEAAQLRKIHAVLDRANVQPGQHILEIGTGWGTLAIEAATKYQCQVTSITLSREQKVLAEERIRKLGLEDKITVLLQDYRAMDTNYKFDHIVSVEMLEAVGPEYLSTFFKCCDQLLKPHGNLSVQVITMPESRYEQYCKKTDFIQKHIFPGGHCPSFRALVNACEIGTISRMFVDEMVNIGPHYTKALLIWRQKFMEHFDEFSKNSGMEHIYDDVFKRKWEYYFAFCQVGFAIRTLGVLQIRFTRENNQGLLAGIPLE